MNTTTIVLGSVVIVGVIAAALLVMQPAQAPVSLSETKTELPEGERGMVEEGEKMVLGGEEAPEVTKNSQTPVSGSYEAYAEEKLARADEGDVVLFFRANWCPTCRTLDAALTAGPLPEGLTVLDLNYDTETALKQKYGVTTQHTLVQIDAKGNLIKKWQGSRSVPELADEVL